MSIGWGVFGAVVGGMFGGPLGALIGGGIGSLINSGRSDRKDFSQDVSTEQIYSALFQCLGKLAKSDGRVSEAEAEYVRSLIHSITSDVPLRRKFIADFNAGRDSGEEFFSLVKKLAVILDAAGERKMCVAAVQVFCSLVVADRRVDRAELKMLKTAGMVLGCPEEVDEFFAGYNHEYDSYQEAEVKHSSLEEAYALLGITPDATDAEVKKAFRKKAKENHPDMAQGAGLSAVKIEEAKKKFQAISLAYEVIREARGMK